MKRVFQILLLTGATLAAPAEEFPVTLLRGQTMTVDVTRALAEGLEIRQNDVSRVLPWVMFSPGTRYRFEKAYRANISGYLAGQPTATLTNEPESGFNPLTPAAAPQELPARKAPTLWTQMPGPVGSLKPASLTGGLAATGADTLFWALQTGPGQHDWVLFGFPSGDSPTLLVQRRTGGKLETNAVAGSRAFSPVPVSGQAGAVEVKLGLQWMAPSGETYPPRLSMDVTMTRGADKAAFRLQGVPAGMGFRDQALFPRPLLEHPAMEFRVRTENEKPLLEGRLRMSRLTLLPGPDMPGQVQVVLSDDAEKKVVLREVLRHADAPSAEGMTLSVSLDALQPGQAYDLTATAELGSLVGTIEHKQTITLPALR